MLNSKIAKSAKSLPHTLVVSLYCLHPQLIQSFLIDCQPETILIALRSTFSIALVRFPPRGVPKRDYVSVMKRPSYLGQNWPSVLLCDIVLLVKVAVD